MCKQLIHHFRKLPRVLRGAEMVGWSFYLVLRRLHAVRFQQCCSNCTAIHSLPPRSNKLVCDIKLDVCRLKTNWKRRLRDTSAVSPVSFNPCSQWKTHYYRTHHHPNDIFLFPGHFACFTTTDLLHICLHSQSISGCDPEGLVDSQKCYKIFILHYWFCLY